MKISPWIWAGSAGLGLAVGVGLLARKKRRNGKVKADCPTVKVTAELMQAKLGAIMGWATKVSKQPDRPAIDAMIEYQTIMFPECRWAPETVTQIQRIDGSTILWSDIVALVGDKTVAELDEAMKPLVPNPKDAGG